VKKLLAASLVLACSTLSLGQQVRLRGTLKTDSGRPVPNTRVIVAGGEGDVTDSRGQFSINLSGDFKEGERIIISVLKIGWVINHPLDGEWNLPNKKLQEIQHLNIVIVPKSSPVLWTTARIQKLISKLSNEVAESGKEGKRPKSIEFTYYLNEWANEYGFTPSEVKQAFDNWARGAASSVNPHVIGLRDFYNKNFASASKNFDKAAVEEYEISRRLKEESNKAVIRSYDNWRLSGNSLQVIYRFSEALERYNRARDLVSKETNPQEWGEILNLIAITKWAIGIRTNSKESRVLFGEAVEALNRALDVYPKQKFPHEWAVTANNLGMLYVEQGQRSEGGEARQLISKAIELYRSALEARPRNMDPVRWALVEDNLGLALAQLSKFSAGNDGVILLNEALQSHRLALEVRTRERFPLAWANTQINIATSLTGLAARESGEARARLIHEMVTAYRSAAEVYTKDKYPEDWALVQNNLGQALRSQASSIEGEEGMRLLDEAESSLRGALTVYKRETLPQPWAYATDNLAQTLSLKGSRIKGAAGINLLREAVRNHKLVLEVRTREDQPQLWAVTQTNLGISLRRLADISDKEDRIQYFGEAIAAFRLALEVRTQKEFPRDWAFIQLNLANAYYANEKWIEAADAYEKIVQFNPDNQTAYRGLSKIYHDILFKYKESYELSRTWVARHPTDLIATSNLVEHSFTFGKFDESESLISNLLTNPKIDVKTKVALKAIEIANLCAQDKRDLIGDRIDTLTKIITEQPVDFKLSWDFNGTINYINSNEAFSPYKSSLLEIFHALNNENRNAMLQSLADVRAKF
jgi:tetratricopeptide (TPR) repeat protein